MLAKMYHHLFSSMLRFFSVDVCPTSTTPLPYQKKTGENTDDVADDSDDTEQHRTDGWVEDGNN